ncbi:futalosine hydrolase [Phosphitispora fastidiosa]|uniref:futalosine hydrolase n=1 Tax=Phosphitispora fastidiosa TaxID=2837202 RepID=UPI001E3CE477|nr:futalosine hydrolase [Phosphitispora fastidiosa]MBU7007294.1 futalosine hydrolase [Phosphitispora fastidiosa]
MKYDLNTGTPRTLSTENPARRILVMTAVPAEREAVLRGLNGDKRFDVLLAGVGPAAAAASTARALAEAQERLLAQVSADTGPGYGLVVSAGIGGGFPGIAEVGSLVVATGIVAADLGVETEESFISLDELGLGSTTIQVDSQLVHCLTEAFRATKLPVVSGPVLTVSTATGTTAGAAVLARRIPGAAAEAMEGYGAAVAAADCGIPILEIRAISNLIGPRDLTKWRIKEALDVLEAAGSALLEVLP